MLIQKTNEIFPTFTEGDNEKCSYVKQTCNEITFSINGIDVLLLKENGDIFVNGKLAETDKEVVNGLRDFLKIALKII